ncbi:MAG: molybdopterin-dependent oxidoreductase, partial [Chloroflexota bacterium]|nr:molybdopterin-dependent oxidoreductase [Chloroflexota bacterium]
PNIFGAAPIASYWINHSRLYRESRIVVISSEHYPLCDRASLWLKPNPGTTPLLLQAMAKQISQLGLDAKLESDDEEGAAWRGSLTSLDMEAAAETTGISVEQIRQAAIIWVTGNVDGRIDRPEGGFPPAAIYHTAARQNAPLRTADYPAMTPLTDSAGDAEAIAAMCANLSMLTGNLGHPGGGVASPRGPANYQGTTDMGCVASYLPGDFAVDDGAARARFEAAWLPRWAERAQTSNGFLPVQSLPQKPGLAGEELVAAIEDGRIKAMFIEDGFGKAEALVDSRLEAVLPKLELLIVAAAFESPLTAHAHVVLPQTLYIEKDGTFTNFDRTVQRVRAAVPAMGDSRSAFDIITTLAQRMGYGMDYGHPSHVMAEISRLVRGYAGVTYARLERGGIVTPVSGFGATSETVLGSGGDSQRPLAAHFAAISA